MGRTRNAHKKRLLERQKTTESEFYRRGHEGLRPLKRPESRLSVLLVQPLGRRGTPESRRSVLLVELLGLAEAPESRPSVLLVERLGRRGTPESRPSVLLVERLGLAEAPESRPSVLLVERLGLAEASDSRRSVLSCRTIRGGGRVETPLSDSEGNLGISELPSGNSPRPLGC